MVSRIYASPVSLSPWSWAMRLEPPSSSPLCSFVLLMTLKSQPLHNGGSSSGMLVPELRRSWADALVQSDVTEPPRACGAGNPETGAGGRSRR